MQESDGLQSAHSVRFDPGRVRIVRNRHGSAAAALAAWNHPDGPLWGEPLRLGPDKWHVYGCHRRRWHPCNVEFLPDRLVIHLPKFVPDR